MNETYVGDNIPAAGYKVLVLAVPHVERTEGDARDAGEEVLDRSEGVEKNTVPGMVSRFHSRSLGAQNTEREHGCRTHWTAWRLRRKSASFFATKSTAKAAKA